MKDRIRINGVLYEAIEPMNESKLRWRVPTERDLDSLGFSTNIGNTLPDGSDPRFYRTKAYKDQVWVLLQGNRHTDSEMSVVLVGDKKYDIVCRSFFRNQSQAEKFFEKAGNLVKNLCADNTTMRGDDVAVIVGQLLDMDDVPRTGIGPAELIRKNYAEYL